MKYNECANKENHLVSGKLLLNKKYLSHKLLPIT